MIAPIGIGPDRSPVRQDTGGSLRGHHSAPWRPQDGFNQFSTLHAHIRGQACRHRPWLLGADTHPKRPVSRGSDQTVLSHALPRGAPFPEPAMLDALAGAMRSWRAVIQDLTCALPATEILVTPFERFADRTDKLLSQMTHASLLPKARPGCLLVQPLARSGCTARASGRPGRGSAATAADARALAAFQLRPDGTPARNLRRRPVLATFGRGRPDPLHRGTGTGQDQAHLAAGSADKRTNRP